MITLALLIWVLVKSPETEINMIYFISILAIELLIELTISIALLISSIKLRNQLEDEE